MNTNANIVATFKDRFGEEKRIHATRHGMRVKRDQETVCLRLNQRINKVIGEKIRERRMGAGMTLEQLCIAAGLSSATPKSRMWAIENSTRNEGVRLGTIYAIAIALNCEAVELLPTTAEASQLGGIARQTTTVSVI